MNQIHKLLTNDVPFGQGLRNFGVIMKENLDNSQVIACLEVSRSIPLCHQ